MPFRRVLPGWFLLVLLPSLLPAQEPLSHIPFCVSDSFSTLFLNQVRFRVSGSDSLSRAAQARVGLAPLPPDDVAVVVDDGVCVSASRAYAQASQRSRGLRAPFPVAVVQAGDRYLVQLPALPSSNPGRAEIIVFDLQFRPVGRYGGGD